VIDYQKSVKLKTEATTTVHGDNQIQMYSP